MSRLSGPGIQFPLTSPQINGAPGVVVLPTGGIYYIPQGNYLAQLGGQTVAQWFDPLNNLWRTFSPSGDLMQISSDGGNYRLINMSGVITGGSITNAGSGGVNGIGPTQTGSTLTFATPAAGGVTGTATGYVIVGGSVAAPTITQGGSGFLVPPMVVCDPPPQGGVQATAVATISAAGVITAVTMVNVGAGYTSAPQWYIVPANFNGYLATADRAAGAFPAPGLIHPNNVWPGTVFQGNINSASGALLTPTALTGSGTATGIVMTYFGAGYTGASSATVTFGGTSIGAAAATAIFSFACNVAIGSTVTATGGANYLSGSPAISNLGMVVGSTNNSTFFPRPIRGKSNNANGSFVVEDPGFGLQSGTITMNEVSVGVATVATVPAANLGGINDFSILQQAVQ